MGAAGASPQPVSVESSDLLAQAFADCEMLIAQGLLALAEREDAKALAADARLQEIADERGMLVISLLASHHLPAEEQWDLGARHEFRAACLREAALAVSVGQFRTDEYDRDPDALAKAHFRAANAAGVGKARRGGVARAASLSPARRESIARGAAIARWWEPQCGHTAGQAIAVGGGARCGVCNKPYKRKNAKGG